MDDKVLTNLSHNVKYDSIYHSLLLVWRASIASLCIALHCIVEKMVASLEDLLEKGAFMGMEKAFPPTVSPGLVMAVEPKHPIIREMLDYYDKQTTLLKETLLEVGLVVRGMTEIFKQHGFIPENRYQEVAGVSIYPADYFDPMDNATGKIKLSINTRTIHRYDRTWSNQSSFYIWLSRLWHRTWLYRLIQNYKA